MTCREEDTAVGVVLSDHVGCGRGRQDRVLADNEFLHPVGGTDLQDGLDGLGGEITTVAPDDERRTLGVDGIKNGLDKVLGVVLQGEVCLSAAISYGTRKSRTACLNTLTLQPVD